MLPAFTEVNRAVLACHGIVALLYPPGNKELLLSYTQSTFETLKMIQEDVSRIDDESGTEYCKIRLQEVKEFFVSIFRATNQSIFRKDREEEVWQLFLDRYNFLTVQLRASVVEIRECVDISHLSSILHKSEKDIYHLPLTAELVIIVSGGNIGAYIEIPCRLLLLDTLLMLQHAQYCHSILEQWSKNQDDPEPILYRARLDAYIRQVVITGASTCEAVLSDYGILVNAIGEAHQSPTKLESFLRWGLTTKLDKFLVMWSNVLELPIPKRSLVVDDMLKLVQIRNRLVHYDGRESAWHALQIDFHWFSDQGFSDRVKQYLNSSSYGAPGTFIGYEIAFAHFFIDTLVEAIDVIHCVVYRDDTEASWIGLSRTPFGGIDFSLMIKTERMLNLQL